MQPAGCSVVKLALRSVTVATFCPDGAQDGFLNQKTLWVVWPQTADCNWPPAFREDVRDAPQTLLTAAGAR